ncbi:Hsp20/alpha crystallin family protein [bacterium]|nr:Hsp20/alpha crystallin family protein [bacterium]
MRNTWNWDPLQEMEDIYRDFHRTFGRLGAPRWTWPFARTSFLPGRAARAYPLLNMHEDADALHIEALAPGVDPDSLKVNIVGDQISIAGEKRDLGDKVKPEEYHRNERAVGSFVRTVALPIAIQPDKVEARYENGLLTVKLPKAEEARPKQISVKVG